MGIAGLDWETIQFSFSAGLQGKGERRVQNPPYLDVCRDAEFDDIGGLRTRKPYLAMSNNILGGGTLSNCRRLFVDGGELCVFTDTGIYSWSPQESAWVLIDTYLAPKISERDVFAATTDQYQGDRAELNNVVMYIWVEGVSATCFFAAYDKTSGAAIQVPLSLGTSPAFPRLTALSTRVLLTYEAIGKVFGVAVDPANVNSSVQAAATTILNTSPASYDVVKIPNADTAFIVAARAATTSYDVAKCTAGMSVTSANKVRVCDGPIACSVDPTSTNVQIVRANGTNIQGDLLAVSNFADVFTAQAVGTAAGTPVDHIAAAHRLVTNGGFYRCYAFWSAQSTTSTATAWLSKFNWVDTNNALGTQATFIPAMDLASRAFAQGSNVFVTGMFNGASPTPGTAGSTAVESTCFVYRDDGRLIARFLRNRAGGFHVDGWLPGVALTSGSTVFSLAGSARRIVPLLLDGTGYAARIPVDITFELDSNEARRTAKVGQTTYISGGLVCQYDGRRVVELGFLPFPWSVSAVHQANAGGSVGDGTYSYKMSYRSTNARGEIDRSTCATTADVVETAGTGTALEKARCTALNQTLKPDVSVEIWRTQKNPNAESDFFRVTSADPSTTGSNNGYYPNDPTVSGFLGFVNDGYADSTLSGQEIHPEGSGVLTYVAPPPGTILLAGPNRLFLAGVPGDPDRVRYSRTREQGKAMSFNDALTIDVTPIGGSITALALHRETLVVFRQSAVYELPGEGFDNARGGQNYGPCRMVSDKVGAVSQEAVVTGPFGTLFKSSQGWQLLTDARTIKYVGYGAAAFDGDTVLSMEVVESQQQVRILTNNRMLFWDYTPGVDQWGEWTISGGLDAVIWQGTHVYLTATGPMQQQSNYASGVSYGMDVETAWIKLNDLQGFGRTRFYELLAEYRSSHLVRLRTAYDYEGDGASGWIFRDDLVMTPTSDNSASSPVVGGTEQVRRDVSRGECEAIKVRITAIADYNLGNFLTASYFTTGGAVTTSGSAWAANIVCSILGAEANAAKLDVYTTAVGDTEVRDHQRFNGTSWITAPYTVGVKVGAGATVADVERYITMFSKLAVIFTPDPVPTKTITNTSTSHSGVFQNASTIQPTGESIKLSGLSLEIGRRKGLYRRLSAAQKG